MNLAAKRPKPSEPPQDPPIGTAGVQLAGDDENSRPDLGALVDEILAKGTGGNNKIDGVEVIDRYPGTNRVRAVRVDGRELTDHQYRRFLALRRGALKNGTSEGDLDLGELADQAIKAAKTREHQRIPGAVAVERDAMDRPKTWEVAGRRLTHGQYVKLRKAYFKTLPADPTTDR